MAREITDSERDLAVEARKKKSEGGKPTQSELRALRHVEREEWDKKFREAVVNISQKLWREWSGRQAKVLNEQADKYGLPFGGATINLPKLARAIHDFLAKNATKLAADEKVNGEQSAIEQLRGIKVDLARLEHAKETRSLIPRSEIHDTFVSVASELRNAGDVLQRRYGPEARQVLDDAIDQAVRVVNERFNSNGNGDDSIRTG